jgi:TolB-like protein
VLSENERIVSDLTEARKLLEKGWTQNAYARNANGVAVDEENPNACSFCVRGALNRAHASLETHLLVGRVVKERTGGLWVHLWNDAPGRTREEVLAMIDEILKAVSE